MKINISLDDALVSRIETYASRNYMSRSGLISFACNQFLNSAEVTLSIKDLSIAMRKIADTGSIDDETQKQLDDFQRLSSLLLPNSEK